PSRRIGTYLPHSEKADPLPRVRHSAVIARFAQAANYSLTASAGRLGWDQIVLRDVKSEFRHGRVGPYHFSWPVFRWVSVNSGANSGADSAGRRQGHRQREKPVSKSTQIDGVDNLSGGNARHKPISLARRKRFRHRRD